MTEAQWKEIYNKFKKSNKPRLEFCEENNLNKATFRKWHNHFEGIKPHPNRLRNMKKDTNTPTKFTEVTIENTEINLESSTPPVIEKSSTITVKVREASIEVDTNFDKNLFKKVMEVLKETC